MSGQAKLAPNKVVIAQSDIMADGGESSVSEHSRKASLDLPVVRGFVVGVVEATHSHSFKRSKKGYCNHCGKPGAPLKCTSCNLRCHDDCEVLMNVPCTEALTNSLAQPVPHRWMEVKNEKKYFCNHCCESLGQTKVFVCLGCRMWTHARCRELVPNSCRLVSHSQFEKESDGEGVRRHHFVAGNLTSRAVCADCEKPINSKDCLTGFTCRWCDMSVHSACIQKIRAWDMQCTMGDFAPCLLTRSQVVSSGNYFDLDTWIRTYRAIDIKLESPYESKDDKDHKPITLFEGANPRSRSQEFRVDGATFAKDLLETGLRQFGIDTASKSDYYLNAMTYKEKMVGVQFLTPKKKVMKKYDSEARGSPKPGRRIDLTGKTFQKRSSLGQQMAVPPLTPVAKPVQVDPSRMDGDEAERKTRVDKVSFVAVQNKPITPKASVSRLRKNVLINKKKHNRETSYFIRSFESDRILQQGGMQLTIYAGPEILSAYFCKPMQATLTTSAHSVLKWAYKELKIRQTLDDIFVEQLVCVNGIVAHAMLGENDPVVRGPLAHANNHINQKSLRLYIRSKLFQEKGDTRTVLVTGLSAKSDITEEISAVLGGFVDWKPLISLGEHRAALIEFSGTNSSIDNCVLSLRNSGMFVTTMMSQRKFKPGAVPLLVFVNTKSGGGQGRELFVKLCKFLTVHQVVDIIVSGGPLEALLFFRDVPEFRILVAGGDGTVGWVLNTLDDVRPYLKCKTPAVSILPVGTGNDLARELGWGPGWEGEHVVPILTSALLAQPCMMDRWRITFEMKDSDIEVSPWTMTNYFGIGLDAHIAMGFHEKREAHPEKFNSRIRNKAHYVQIGTSAMLSHPCKGFGKYISMSGYLEETIEWKELDTSGFEGIVVLNISSFGGGASPWGSKSNDKQYTDPSFSDGIFEVFGVSGIVHLSAIGGHTATGKRIGQFSKLRIEVREKIICQVDGEPFRTEPCTIEINKLEQQTCMATLSKELARNTKELWKKQPSLRSKEHILRKRSSTLPGEHS